MGRYVAMTGEAARKKRLALAGSALFPMAVALVNWFFPGDPGFALIPLNPSLYACVFIAAFYGRACFLAAMSSWALAVLVLLPLGWYLEKGGALSAAGALAAAAAALKASGPALALGLMGGMGVAMARARLAGRARRLREGMRRARAESESATREVQAFKMVTDELERRVSRQSDSITLLSGKINELYSLDIARTLRTLLEIVGQFTGSHRSSLWKLDPAAKALVLWGAEGAPVMRESEIPLEGTIEGWAARNNQLFSARMLIQYENLRRMDRGRAVYTAPVLSGRKVWGVLDVEDLPFERFNEYTEKLLRLILLLAAPAIERAAEYEGSIAGGRVDPITGFPAHADFLKAFALAFREAAESGRSICLFVYELGNYEALAAGASPEEMQALLKLLSEGVARLGHGAGYFFQYDSPARFAAFYEELDSDGASLLSLEVFEMVTAVEWRLGGRVVKPELRLGFAAGALPGEDEAVLMERAERLLELQKQ